MSNERRCLTWVLGLGVAGLALATDAGLTSRALHAERSRFAVRAFNCDDGCRVSLDGQAIASVSFGQDSGWVDITQRLQQQAGELLFECVNVTGAITYGFEVRVDDSVVWRQACGTAGVIGCDNNVPQPPGVAREFRLPLPLGPLPLSPWKEQVSDSVHIFYYPWYGEEPGCSAHWAQGDHDPRRGDIASNFYPTLRAYNSTDPAVVEQHMKWIREAGVGVITLEWWGPPGSCEDRRTPLILDQAQRAGLMVNFSLAYKKVKEGNRGYVPDHPQKVVRDVKYANETYGSHPAFYRNRELGNRPVFYVFESPLWPKDWSVLDALSRDNIILAQTTTPELTEHFSGAYTYDVGPVCPSASTEHWKAISEHCRKHDLVWAPSVGPGYIDQRAVPDSKAKTLDRKDGRTYDCQWEQALLSEPTWITVTSFNEWHEGTQIEPATNDPPVGFEYLTYEGAYGRTDATAERAYLDRTRYHVERFDPGMLLALGGPPKRSLVKMTVVGVQDGDTLFLRGAAEAQLRLIGVDTPELEPNLALQKDEKQWCTRSEDVAFMAEEAAEFVDRWLGYPRKERPVEVTVEVPSAGKRVDALGRLLGYVSRRGQAGDVGQSLSGALLRQGYSQAFLQDYGETTPFDNISADQASILRGLEGIARTEKQGFWGAYRPKKPRPWPGLSQEYQKRCASRPSTIVTSAAVVGVLDFDEYVQATYVAKGQPPLNLIRLWPLVHFSEGRFESLMASLSFELGSQPYEERLRQAQNEATQRLSQLQQRLTPHHQFSILVEGEERATFSVARCLIDNERAGDLRLRCEGTLRLDGPEPKDVQRWLGGAVALSPAVPQKRFWAMSLTLEQLRQLDQAVSRVFARAQRFVPAQRQVKRPPDTADQRQIVLDLDRDGLPEVFRSVHVTGQPCNHMSATFFGSWAGSQWATVRQSIYLEECAEIGESAGEDYFSPQFVDIDGDGTVEILMTEGRYESHEWSLYRLVGGALRRLVTIGAYGS